MVSPWNVVNRKPFWLTPSGDARGRFPTTAPPVALSPEALTRLDISLYPQGILCHLCTQPTARRPSWTCLQGAEARGGSGPETGGYREKDGTAPRRRAHWKPVSGPVRSQPPPTHLSRGLWREDEEGKGARGTAEGRLASWEASECQAAQRCDLDWHRPGLLHSGLRRERRGRHLGVAK